MTDLFADLAWATVRLETIDRFAGETPRPDTESAIIHVFELAPKAVLRAIDEVAEARDRGEIRSGWAVLRTRLEQRSHPVRDVTVQGIDERAKRITQAEQWLRSCGPHFDRDTEVLDKLFGDRGLLQAWHDDQPLRQRMLEQWAEQRQRGEQLENDEHERAQRLVEQRRCRHCGAVTPFAMRPCATPACRRRAAAALLAAEAEAASTTIADEPEPVLDPDAEPQLA